MAYKKFPDKDPAEVLDYSQHFSELLSEGIELDSIAEIEVESAKLAGAEITVGGADDPTTLVVHDENIIVSDTPGISDTVVFWASAGTLGVTYTILLKVTDSENVTPDRTFVRRATIKIAKK